MVCIELMTNICTNSINTIKITNFNNKAYILCRKGLLLLTLKKITIKKIKIYRNELPFFSIMTFFSFKKYQII